MKNLPESLAGRAKVSDELATIDKLLISQKSKTLEQAMSEFIVKVIDNSNIIDQREIYKEKLITTSSALADEFNKDRCNNKSLSNLDKTICLFKPIMQLII